MPIGAYTAASVIGHGDDRSDELAGRLHRGREGFLAERRGGARRSPTMTIASSTTRPTESTMAEQASAG
jgi:hypothetical protein